jgi:hypothetical protein
MSILCRDYCENILATGCFLAHGTAHSAPPQGLAVVLG